MGFGKRALELMISYNHKDVSRDVLDNPVVDANLYGAWISHKHIDVNGREVGDLRAGPT